MIFDYLLLSILIFLGLLRIIVFVDIITSWTILFWFELRINFIRSITLAIYNPIRRYIPTTFGPIDFVPFFVLFAIQILYNLIVYINPNILNLLY